MIATLVLAAALLGSPPADTRGTTDEERTLGWLQTVCDDGTRAVSP